MGQGLHSSTTALMFTPEVAQIIKNLIVIMDGAIDDFLDRESIQEKVTKVLDFVSTQSFPVIDEENLSCITFILDGLLAGVEMEMEKESILKLETNYKDLRSDFSETIKSAESKLEDVNKEEERLETELAAIKQQLLNVQAQKQKLKNPLDRSKTQVDKIDRKLLKISSDLTKTLKELCFVESKRKKKLLSTRLTSKKKNKL
ncbi:hypothetical protein PIB30_052602 [Stylosanthes scabra]|uniref:Uncharacterized protein n=1 Tax=Stylosanthes scabra TaxID=79078 RepID=A0ABU6RIC9_9FABA|nr:hypothetical protein [Stylosanthes scabra]